MTSRRSTCSRQSLRGSEKFLARLWSLKQQKKWQSSRTTILTARDDPWKSLQHQLIMSTVNHRQLQQLLHPRLLPPLTTVQQMSTLSRNRISRTDNAHRVVLASAATTDRATMLQQQQQPRRPLPHLLPLVSSKTAMVCVVFTECSERMRPNASVTALATLPSSPNKSSRETPRGVVVCECGGPHRQKFPQ